MTMVSEASMEVDASEHRKSTDTSGSSQTARKPAGQDSGASFATSFTH